MLAFSLVIGIFCFWSLVGFAIVSALYTRRNILQSSLLAPVTGLSATVLLVTTLNWVAPVRIIGPIATVLLLALSAWLLCRRPFPVPFRRLAPFAAVVLLAAIAVGYPMFRFGFNWVSYCNEDMANYCLSAKFLLNHNQFTAPSAQAVLGDRDASLLFWYFDVMVPMRHGADEVLAWALSLTGLASHEAFMPVIVAFQLALITATGALVLQGKKYRHAALLVCFWLAFSALIALGSVYQLLGQVSGLAALCGAAAVLLRRVASKPRSMWLGGLLLASLSTLYPEVLPFLVIGYMVYHAISILNGFERVRDLAGTFLPILAAWVLFVNVSFAVPILTLLLQSKAIVPNGATVGLFPFYMTPAAFAYVWGFRAISEAPQGILLDTAIISGALVFGIAIFGAVWNSWKGTPVAVMCLIMMGMSLVLFRTNSEFGLYKLAMYLQPFLVGVMVLTWSGLRDQAGTSVMMRALLVGGLALIIGLGARGQLFYTFRSLALGGGGLIEIPFASRDKLISQLKALPTSSSITVSDTSNGVLAKFESAYSDRLYFLCQDFFQDFFVGFTKVTGRRFSWLNPIYVFNRAAALKLMKAGNKSQLDEAFDLRGALSSPDRFTVSRIVSGDGQFRLIEDSAEISVLNRRAKTSRDSLQVTSTQSEQDRLSFASSEFGQYYATHGASRSLISLYQPEDDFFFRGAMMVALGRISLFRILHPSSRVRLVLEYSASLNHDGQNRIPAASVIGDTREMFTVVGRGSSRLISPALQPQQIAGGEYIALDMGTWGHTFPDSRSFIMGLWGRAYVADNRRIVGFCRDISLISDDQYLAVQAPRAVQSFPGDLKNKNLEYSGVYEDGWVAESSDIVLQQDTGFNHLVVSILVPTFRGRRVASWMALLVDGHEVARRPIGSSGAGVDVIVPGSGRRRVGLRFDTAANLPNLDTRPVSAKLRYAGFQP